MSALFHSRYEFRALLYGINPLNTNMTITNRLRNTISTLKLHVSSSVRVINSTHSFQYILYLVQPVEKLSYDENSTVRFNTINKFETELNWINYAICI